MRCRDVCEALLLVDRQAGDASGAAARALQRG